MPHTFACSGKAAPQYPQYFAIDYFLPEKIQVTKAVVQVLPLPFLISCTLPVSCPKAEQESSLLLQCLETEKQHEYFPDQVRPLQSVTALRAEKKRCVVPSTTVRAGAVFSF